ncbi:MAG TPA: PAS domain S-box protein, partial [Thermodesulfobacteriota bacterium]
FHPYLAGMAALITAPQNQKDISLAREQGVGPSWYHQSIFYSSQWNRIRIYGFDITEKTKAEGAIRESEKKFRELFEGSQDGYVRVDMGGKIQECNTAYRKMLGYTAEELKKLTYLDLTPQKWHGPEAEIVKNAVLPLGYSGVYEKEYIRKGGTIFPVSLRTYLIKDPDGNPLGMWAFIRDNTERKRMEEELRRSRDEMEKRVEERTAELSLANQELQQKETLLRRVLENLPVGVWITDPQGRIIQSNPAGQQIWGGARYVGIDQYREYKGRWADTGKRIEAEEWALARAVQKGETSLNEVVEIECFDGRRKTILNSAVPLRGPGQEILGAIVVNEDITERKRAEESLALERNRLKGILDNMPNGVYISNQGYEIEYLNPLLEKEFGPLNGRKCYEYFHGRKEVCPWCKNEEAFAGRTVRWEWFSPKNGKTYDLFDTPVPNADGTLSKLEIFHDITDRKKAEEAMRQNEQLLRNVLELLPVGVWIADKEGVITYGNPAGHRIWAGYRYVGVEQFGEYKGWWLDTGKRIKPEEWGVARAIRKGETSLNEEIEIECFDGSHKFILNSVIPLRNEKNEISGAFVINDDLTERRRTEQTIRQMQKMEALGTLAGGIAHDFNNILMPITINAEMALLDVKEGTLPPASYLQLIREAANRGQGLVKQIITFSRQKEQPRQPIEIIPVIKEALKFLRAMIPKSIEIRPSIGVESAVISADPTQLHQVLMNLCNNAAYAMREKGGVLEVNLAKVEVDPEAADRVPELKPRPYLRLTVRDTGHGMGREVRERAFDPFFTTKKPGEGAGMGLAVVHGIVKNHEGVITLESEVGRGTTARVFFPLVETARESEVVSPDPIPGGDERILLIDDEEIQILSLKQMLERLGYRVTGK